MHKQRQPLAKAGLQTAKALPCVAHDKKPTATKWRQRPSLLWVFRRAHDKRYAVCKTWHSAKKRRLTAADSSTSFAVCPDCRHMTKKSPLPCALDFAHGKGLFQAGLMLLFAVCIGLCTRQRLDFFSVFSILSCIWNPNHIILATHIYESSHRTHFI